MLTTNPADEVWTLADIARITGMPRRAVESRMRRSRLVALYRQPGRAGASVWHADDVLAVWEQHAWSGLDELRQARRQARRQESNEHGDPDAGSQPDP